MEKPLLPFIPTPEEKAPPDFFTKYRYPILGLLMVVLGFGTYITLTPPASQLAGADVLLADEAEASGEEPTPTTDTLDEIVVDIAGGVIAPGVYYLPSGSILETAIEASGGFSPQADTNEVARSINRAEQLANHSKIYIPKKGDTQIVYVGSSSPTSSPSGSPARININTASAAELDSLPGIGEVLAQRIIDYRLKNGSFGTLEEIQEVAGISQNKFSEIKDRITI